jgi:AcrR family transcriptional regulator
VSTASDHRPDKRAEIITAAERLFAARGVDAVSLREINREAGQRNTSALQYHFGTRSGLLHAILAKHRPDVEARRHALLDEWEGAGRDDLRGLSAALVLPLTAKLADADGGREYLQIMGELVNRPDPEFDPATMTDPADTTNRWRELVGPLLGDEAVRVFHARFTAIRFAHVELARRARGRPRRDDRLFASRTVDLVTALLDAPVTDETRRLLTERSRPERSRPERTRPEHTRRTR